MQPSPQFAPFALHRCIDTRLAVAFPEAAVPAACHRLQEAQEAAAAHRPSEEAQEEASPAEGLAVLRIAAGRLQASASGEGNPPAEAGSRAVADSPAAAALRYALKKNRCSCEAARLRKSALTYDA